MVRRNKNVAHGATTPDAGVIVMRFWETTASLGLALAVQSLAVAAVFVH